MLEDGMPASQTPSAKAGYHHGDLGTTLIHAIRGLIERDGIGDFSISQACKAIGVSTAAPYKHFADKHDILWHVAMTGFDDLRTAMERARDGESDEDGRRIADMGKAYVAFAIDSPETFKLMFGSKPDIKNDEASKQTCGRCFDVLIAEVATYLGSKTESDESRQLSVILWTFVHGVASLTIDRDYEAADVPIGYETLIDIATERLLPRR